MSLLKKGKLWFQKGKGKIKEREQRDMERSSRGPTETAYYDNSEFGATSSFSLGVMFSIAAVM